MATALRKIVPTARRYDWRKAPWGMTYYDKAGRTFNRLHQAGSMMITGSGIPNLFGEGWASRYTYALHMRGDVPLPYEATPLMERGHLFEKAVMDMFSAETGRETRQLKAWGVHPELDFLSVSPDGAEVDRLGAPLGPCEVKVVAASRFVDRYQNGDRNAVPVVPIRELLQHQAQLEVANQNVGPIVVLQIGEYIHKCWHWNVERHQPTVDRILEECRDFHRDLRAGKLPDPDHSDRQDRAAIAKLFKVVDAAEPIDLRGDPELEKALRRYQQANRIKNKAEDQAAECKSKMVFAMGPAPLALIGDKQIKATMVHKAAHHVDATSYRGFWLSDAARQAAIRAKAAAKAAKGETK